MKKLLFKIAAFSNICHGGFFDRITNSITNIFRRSYRPLHQSTNNIVKTVSSKVLADHLTMLSHYRLKQATRILGGPKLEKKMKIYFSVTKILATLFNILMDQSLEKQNAKYFMNESFYDIYDFRKNKKQISNFSVQQLQKDKIFNNLIVNTETKNKILFITSTIGNGLKKNKRYAMLIKGPTGTGKTVLVKKIASYLGLKLKVTSAGRLLIADIKQSMAVLKKLLKSAKKPDHLVFIDEVDLLLKDRSHLDITKLNEKEALILERLRMLVSEFMSLTGSNDVNLACATNVYSNIDEAFPRRFFFTLEMILPNKKERAQIFYYYFQKLQLQCQGVPLNKLVIIAAKMTSSFSGSDIENICNTLLRYKIATNSSNIMYSTFISILKNAIDARKAIGVTNPNNITDAQIGSDQMDTKVNIQNQQLNVALKESQESSQLLKQVMKGNVKKTTSYIGFGQNNNNKNYMKNIKYIVKRPKSFIPMYNKPEYVLPQIKKPAPSPVLGQDFNEKTPIFSIHKAKMPSFNGKY